MEGLLHRDEERLKVVMIGRIGHGDIIVRLCGGEWDELLLLDALCVTKVTSTARHSEQHMHLP